jgi:large subunit ribosomal protein L3
MPDIKGIVGEKVGMTQIFVETRAVPVTVIKAGPCVVTQIRTQANDGYDAVQLAYGTMRPRDVSKPTQGHFDKAGVEPARYVVELRTDDAGTYEPGQQITVDAFEVGEKVDVVGVSKGKGFSGVMKRHGFRGLGGGHGVHKKHRSPGAIGACATPSRVFKGMRMAGQFGNQRTTVLNLEVVQSDPERGLLLVKGAVPGPNGGLVMVRSAVKTPLKAGAQKGAA